MRYLKTIVSLPYCTPSGRVVTRSGYDEETQLFLHLPLDYAPRVPARPTPDMIRKAVGVLVAPWSGYGFAAPDDAAAMVSAILAAVCRPVLEICPMVAFDACQQGSGKTKAALALGSLIEGELAPVTPFSGAADEELRKRLSAGAMEGSRFTCLDNVTGYFKSETVAAVLTSGRLKDRKLGVMKNEAMAVRDLMVVTGNNLCFAADIARRATLIRIDAGSNPTHKAYKFDPVRLALATRRGIAEAACVIWNGFFAAQGRAQYGGVGGFDDWARLCREPVLWLKEQGLADGLPWVLGDPAASLLKDAGETDPELQVFADMVKALHTLSEGGEFTAANAAAWCRAGAMGSPDRPAGVLRESVSNLLRKSGDISAVTLGLALRNRRDRPTLDGLKIIQWGGQKGRGSAWRVVRGNS